MRPPCKRWLFYTLNTPEVLRSAEDRDTELSIRLFSTRLPLKVVEFANFARQHSAFLLVVKTPLAPNGTDEGISVRSVGSYSGGEKFNFAQFFIYEN